jgi:hypothetical protein
MTTNQYPGVGFITQGRDHNFYKLIPVIATAFGQNTDSGQQPDCLISFSTKGLSFINYGTLVTHTIEYSFNGTTVHGELSPTTGSSNMLFLHRAISLVWFRIKSGSTTATIRVEAW